MSLNHFYLKSEPLWSLDFDTEGFSWIDPDNREQNLISFRRFSKDGEEMIVVVTFSGSPLNHVKIPVKKGYRYRLAFESSPGVVSYDHVTFEGNIDSYLSCNFAPFSGAVWLVEDEKGQLFSLN